MKHKSIQLHNLRLGFATNSSSTHSLLWVDGLKFEDSDKVGVPIEGEYGWDYFTVKTTGEKRHYLGIALENALRAFPNRIQDFELDTLIGLKPPDGDCYIDHQSMITFPHDYHYPSFIDREFFEQLRNFILKPGIVILGGNDNNDKTHELVTTHSDASHFTLPFTDTAGGMVARYDPEGDYWALFNRETGNKIRFSFVSLETDSDDWQPAELKSKPQHAFAPELVDLKITDYCERNCAFCYEGSSPTGKHGDIWYINHVLGVLSQNKVFEVAIGGGEPTSHKGFVDILQYARRVGIVPNFTTRSLDWLKSGKKEKILEAIGGFAYSVDSESDVKYLKRCLDDANVKPKKCYEYSGIPVYIHITMGTIDRVTFGQMLRLADEYDFRVTLLGFKAVGRGEMYKPTAYGWWLEVVNELRETHELPWLGIDTTLASGYEQQILDSNIPDWLFHTIDGTFSACIDGVSQTMSAASYIKRSEVSLPIAYKNGEKENKQLFLEAWQKVRKGLENDIQRRD